MNSSYQKIVILLIAFAAIAWTAWQKLEWTDEKQWVAADAEVLKRPMLAAGLFLESQGILVSRVISQRSFDQIPDDVGTLFICEGKLLLSETHFYELERWLSNGGHLVINAAGGGELFEDDDEPEQSSFKLRSMPVADLFREQGIRVGNEASSQDCWQQHLDFEPTGEGSDTDTELQQVIDAFSGLSTEISAIEFSPVLYDGKLPGNSAGRKTAVEFEGANWLQHEAPYEANWHWPSERGTQLLSAAYGRGQLTVMSDFSPFFNASIGMHDNAFALKQIISAGSGGNNRVWFHERDLAFPSLFSVLWHKAPWVIVSALLAFFILFWSLLARRNEPTVEPQSSESQLSKQLYAVAFYRWRVRDMNQISRYLLPSKTPQTSVGNKNNNSQPEQESIRHSKADLIQHAQLHWQATTHSRGNKKHG